MKARREQGTEMNLKKSEEQKPIKKNIRQLC